MTTFAANIELLYTEHEKFEDRIAAAAADGFKFVEMWMSSLQDVHSLASAAKQHGIQFSSVLAEPRFSFTMPGVDLNVFFDGLKSSIENAKTLGSPRLVVGSGMGFPGKKRPAQLDTLAEVFTDAAKIAEEAGIELVLEPVNTRHDHPGALLDRTEEAIYIAQKVASPNFKILYDIYHSSVEGENVIEMLTKHKNLIGYVQLADAPGRGEPGSGKIDWKPIMAAVDANYQGVVGLEYYPTQDTSKSIEYIKSFA